MSLELLVLVYMTFKRHRGLYFWSIIITTCGIILQTTGYILKEFKNDSPAVLTTIICKAGWVMNVSGFSVVLWSRLHLVVNSPRVLKLVLTMIIINGILLHTPVVVFEFGLMSSSRHKFLQPMEIMERIQQTIFTLQETLISGLYIYNTSRFLGSGFGSRTRKVIALLVLVQLIVIVFDSGLTVLDYHNMFTLKCTVHPFVYTIKLKLEFVVLNQLLSLAKRGLTPGLSLPSVNTLDASSEGAESGSISSSSSLGQTPQPAEKGKTQIISDFITRPPIAAGSTGSKSSSVLATEITDDRDASKQIRHSGQTLLNEESDLKNVIGIPDDDGSEDGTKITDLERQYLGRYSH